MKEVFSDPFSAASGLMRLLWLWQQLKSFEKP
jgi:hypothetical protein